MNDASKNGKTDSCAEFGVVVLSLCTYRLSQPSVATLCSLFSLKRKIFLFSKFLLFYYLKNCGDDVDDEYFIDIMEGNGILHTIYVCLLYFVFGCEFVIFLFLAPTIDIYKHKMGLMVLQTRLPLTGIFKETGFLRHRLYWCCMSLLETNQSDLQLQCDVTRSDIASLKLGDF